MVVVSVSRRTDIPAFYTDWFFNRISAGYAISLNPFNPKQANLVPLSKDAVDCFVFWSKNPRPLLDRIDEIKGYCYYLHYTLNAYGKEIETNVPSCDKLIKSFEEFSETIGKDRVIWRYDPVVIDDKHSIDWHIEHFDELASELHQYTTKCVFSFADPYRKGLHIASILEMDTISKAFFEICEKYKLELCTCSENREFPGIKHNKCIDDELIKKLFGKTVDSKLDGQRKNCGCVKCSDIGYYDSCTHGCTYCYANKSTSISESNRSMHDPESEILIGHLGDDVVVYRDGKVVDKHQMHII